MQFDRLFSPVKIRGLEIKNRTLMPAIHLLYNMDGYANDRFKEFYRRRAEGGVGLIITGGCRFDEYGGSPGMMSLENDSFIPGYKDFTDCIHKEGAKAAVQLYHAGAYAHQIANEGRQALAPSAVFSKFTKEMPREASIGELSVIIEKMAAAAKRAREAGFDAVEISASAGYLICQFLSPKTNLRTDEYGGSWENRTRFARQAVSAVRRAVGEDYPVLMRISGNDFVPGSNTGEDAVSFARLMEEAGVDMINVTGGWHETTVPQLTGDLPRGGFSYLASSVKSAVSIPVAASNRINDPAAAEMILAAGQADMVSLGRTLIADPQWVNKVREGDTGSIRHCVACNQGCLAKTFFAMPVECLVNAEAGREYEVQKEKPGAGKNILVVGAGPAGCEFALRAAGRGHSVTLWEKSGRIGGQLNLAAKVPSKHEFMGLVEYYEHMLEKSGVKLHLCKEASAGEIKEMYFDHVITAAGSIQKSLELPEIKGIKVCGAFDILSGKVIAGKNVLMIGGGAVGCECAEYIAREASLSPEQAYFLLSRRAETPEKVLSLMDKCERKISIIDGGKIGSGFEQGTAWPLMKELDRFGVEKYPFAKLMELNENGALVSAVKQKSHEQKEREREMGIKEPDEMLELSIPCDTVVISVGSKPETGLYDQLKALGVSVFAIGDCTGSGKVSDEIGQAAKLAGSI